MVRAVSHHGRSAEIRQCSHVSAAGSGIGMSIGDGSFLNKVVEPSALIAAACLLVVPVPGE
jgi:hypothetical protein